MFPGDASPEAAVMHFYASRMRGDKRWQEVIPTPPSERLKRQIAEYDAWRFLKVRLVGKRPTAGDPEAFSIRVLQRG